ncbi:hypothetical protein RvY_06507-2 [Ramazzottius varieornatus]|uniref:Chitin-binding type-2 domain-containing protein n=1 Tax=Ramazzottius varieornatus TaxID=947166 RepID=A0A1D1UZA0_RAMVA|nr:hypothetical protein RvY_06507-2 [Ramazzottius varieornatus]
MEKWYCNGVYGIVFPVFFSVVIYGRYPQQRSSQSAFCNGPPGYKADVLSGCETYHYCHSDGTRESFSCPFGMVFDEMRSTCDTWNNVNCPGPTGGIVSASSPEGTSPNQPPPASDVPPNPPAHLPSSPPNPANPNGGTPMDFLAALLFPPLSNQQNLGDFVHTAPSGVRQSFMRVAGEGQLSPNQPYPPYVEPLSNTPYRPVPQEHPSYNEGGSRGGGGMGGMGRESPASNNGGYRGRNMRPSPAMNPLEMPPSNQHGYDSGPVPPHLMERVAGPLISAPQSPALSYSHMFGQLNMPTANNTYSIPPSLQPIPGLTPNAQIEALRPIWQSLRRNPYQPHLRRMASLIAGGTAMDMGIVNGNMVNDPLGTKSAVDPALDPALAGAKKSKALDDGLVDARR